MFNIGDVVKLNGTSYVGRIVSVIDPGSEYPLYLIHDKDFLSYRDKREIGLLKIIPNSSYNFCK